MGVEGQHHAPTALPPGKTRYPFYRRLGAPQDRSGRLRKISPPPGFDPRTVQPVASRYTDWAMPAAAGRIKSVKNANDSSGIKLWAFQLVAQWRNHLHHRLCPGSQLISEMWLIGVALARITFWRLHLAVVPRFLENLWTTGLRVCRIPKTVRESLTCCCCWTW